MAMRYYPRMFALALAIVLWTVTLTLRAQEHTHAGTEPAALQPLAQQARRVQIALAFLGQPLPPLDRQAIDDAIGMSDEPAAVARLQQMTPEKIAPLFVALSTAECQLQGKWIDADEWLSGKFSL